jgi:hypothetical protein
MVRQVCYILADHIRSSLLAKLSQIPNEICSKIRRKKQLRGLLLIDFWILSLLKAEENYLDLQNIMGNPLPIQDNLMESQVCAPK